MRVSIFSWHCRIDASKIVKVFEIAVELAAGGVFARLELQDVRQARRPFIRLSEKQGLQITMKPHWACVVCPVSSWEFGVSSFSPSLRPPPLRGGQTTLAQGE